MSVVSRMLQVASPDYLAQGKCERSCLLAFPLVHTCCSCVQLRLILGTLKGTNRVYSR